MKVCTCCNKYYDDNQKECKCGSDTFYSQEYIDSAKRAREKAIDNQIEHGSWNNNTEVDHSYRSREIIRFDKIEGLK